MSDTASIVPQALTYARRGWPVFPCRPGEKAPATPHGFYDATTDEAMIATWWTRRPSCNVAVRTGAPGPIVIDVDPRGGGDATLARLEVKLGPLPTDAPRVATPGGGMHFYFQAPTDGEPLRSGASVLGLGLDVKAGAGYVLAPPSVVRRADGTAGVYRWLVPPPEDGRLPPLPPAWLARLRERQARRTTTPLSERLAERIPVGARHDALVALAGKLRGAGLDDAAVLAAISAMNKTRCDPPLSQEEVEKIARSTAHWAPNPTLRLAARPAGDTGAGGGDGEDGDARGDTKEGRGRPSAAKVLVELVAGAGVDLFHDPQQRAWATVPAGPTDMAGGDGAVPVTLPLRGSAFRAWLSHQFYRHAGRPAPAQAVQDALAVLEHRTVFDGEERPVHVRLAGDLDRGRVVLDLGRPDGLAVTITADRWTVGPPPDDVRFWRPAGLRPLPEPVPAPPDTFWELRRILPHLDDGDITTIVAFLVAACHPRGPYPILVLSGEAGAGKTLLARLVRAVVDPQVPATRRPPREERELFIAAGRQHVYALDNLTHINDLLTDGLCVLVTGGGYGTRTLYETVEETILDVVRPVVLTAIYLNARQDLADRTWPVTVPPLSDGQRLDEATVWGRFVDLHPRLLGALCTAVSAALRHLPTTSVRATTRMADSVRWVTAAERGGGLPWAEGTVAGTLTAQRLVQAQEAVLQSALADALARLVTAAGGRWQGTALQLLRLVDDMVEPKERPQDWPRTAEGLAAQLRRLSPELRRAGLLDVSRRREGHAGARLLVLTRLDRDAGAGDGDKQREEYRTKLSAPSALSATDAVDGLEPTSTAVDSRPADSSADSSPANRQQLSATVSKLSAPRVNQTDGPGRTAPSVDGTVRPADGADSADSSLPSFSASRDDGWEVFRP
jgi:hypothetical protein